MIDYIKKELRHLPFTIIVFVLLYGITTLASSYAIGSGDIEFDNTGTEIQSTNVQGAVNEVFQHATDYNEIKYTIGSGSLNTTSQNIIGAVNEVKGKIDDHYPVLLYRNTNITMAENDVFTVSNLSSYSFIIVVYSYCDTDSTYGSVFSPVVNGKAVNLITRVGDAEHTYEANRTLTMNTSTNKVTASAGYFVYDGSQSKSPYYAIPRYIYGIK